MNESSRKNVATEIEIVGREKVIVRWEDGHLSEFAAGYLRVKCPCATCTSEPEAHARPIPIGIGTPLPLMPGKARAGVYPLDIVPVGHYAVRIEWSDGHSTGIYSFQYLRSICPCGECGGSVPGSK